MRRSEKEQTFRDIMWAFAVYLAFCVAGALITSCTGYFAPGGASLYCKDRDGKAIHCPETRDSTKADTTHTER